MDLSELTRIWPDVKSIVRITKENCNQKGMSYGRRVVKHYEIDYITGGNGMIITNGKKIEAKKGRLFLREPGMVVEGIGTYHCYFLILNLHLFDEKKEGMTNNDQVDHMPIYYEIENQVVIEQLLRILYMNYLKGEADTVFEDRARLMQIFLMLYEITKRYGKNRLNSPINEKIRIGIYKVVSKIEERPTDYYNINLLSEVSGYNKHYFCRLFKKETGDTPIAYVNKCRLNYIKRELIETERSIKELFMESGFENEAYFFRIFKKMTGTTPTTYRRIHRELY